MRWESEILNRGIPVEYRWLRAHEGVEGNEEADQHATKAVYKYRGQYTVTQNPMESCICDTFAHISRRLTETKWEESKKAIEQMRKKSKHSYQYDLAKWGGNCVVMKARKTIAVRFYQLKSGHGLMVQYLRRIGKRRDMKCWWCGHEYQRRDHLFKWCKRWKHKQKRLWVDRQEGEDGYEGIEKVFKKPKIRVPMSLVFPKNTCSKALLDILFHTYVNRINGGVQ